jgi:hypothetical protein
MKTASNRGFDEAFTDMSSFVAPRETRYRPPLQPDRFDRKTNHGTAATRIQRPRSE